MPRMKRVWRLSRRRKIGLTLFGIALLITAGWTGGFFLRDSSQAASISQALRLFRAGKHGSSGLNGVYIYATNGSESVNALGGARHVYPARTSITAIEVPCGIRLRWAALEKRSTTWTFCSTPAGVELRVSDERHAFYNISDHSVYLCTDRVLIPKKPVDGTTTPFSCRSSRNLEVGETRIIDHGALDIAGRRVEAIRVSTDLTIRSRDSGSESIEWWLDTATALPLRIELRSRTSRKMWVGRVKYHEDLSLRLLSLTPLR
ncbi:MAG: hypothetical protein WBQ14_04750 [Gaiellaceae bacterium]